MYSTVETTVQYIIVDTKVGTTVYSTVDTTPFSTMDTTVYSTVDTTVYALGSDRTFP